jgi:hypothetical protein
MRMLYVYADACYVYAVYVKVAALSGRFLDAKAADYIFQGHSGKEVPAEGFSDYARQLWESIESDKDLDLPSQRKMLSMVCLIAP